jgi:hypothetical protein
MCVTIFMVLGNNLVAQDTFNCVIILLIIITFFSSWLSYNCCPHFKWLVGWFHLVQIEQFWVVFAGLIFGVYVFMCVKLLILVVLAINLVVVVVWSSIVL